MRRAPPARRAAAASAAVCLLFIAHVSGGVAAQPYPFYERYYMWQDTATCEGAPTGVNVNGRTSCDVAAPAPCVADTDDRTGRVLSTRTVCVPSTDPTALCPPPDADYLVYRKYSDSGCAGYVEYSNIMRANTCEKDTTVYTCTADSWKIGLCSVDADGNCAGCNYQADMPTGCTGRDQFQCALACVPGGPCDECGGGGGPGPTCPPGHYGPECTDCALCTPHGTCQEGAYGQCICHDGWAGSTCSECAPGHFGPNCTACSACGAHGTCEEGLTGKCVCDAGWAGATCTTCASGHYSTNCTSCDLCTPHGTCRDGLDGSCTCEAGWAGPTCSFCNHGHFGHNCTSCEVCEYGDCHDGQCHCNEGRAGFACQECQPGLVPAGSTCAMPCTCAYPWCNAGQCYCGGYLCVRCTDHCDKAVCTNDWNGTCACEAGWAGARCNECAQGYFGDSCESCALCHAGACVDQRCQCHEGWQGAYCDDCTAERFGPDCSYACAQCGVGTETCVAGLQGYCKCAAGYTGLFCDTCVLGYVYDGHQCLPCSECGPHGHCSDDSHTSGCACDAGWAGPLCDGCASGYYLAEGTCQPCAKCLHGNCTLDQYSCQCHSGWAGSYCDQCTAGYYGAECTYRCDDCELHGNCTEGLSGACVCAEGWTGPTCGNLSSTAPGDVDAAQSSSSSATAVAVGVTVAVIVAVFLLGVAGYFLWQRRTAKKLEWQQKKRMEMMAIEDRWQYPGGNASAAQYSQMATE